MANHISLDASRFDPSNISEETRAFNKGLQDIMSKGPKWYQVGAEKYRQMRANGETPLPATVYLDSAETFSIPSRDQGRSIPCRILRPEGSTAPKGVFMHIHGGGWVLQDEKSSDHMLQGIATSTNSLAISVGYRLAPEHPFPAGSNDCFDAAEWLIHNAPSTFGAPLCFAGGESAGAHLSMLVALHLLNHSDPRYSQDFGFKGLLLHFGPYDLTFSPSVYTFKREPTLVLDRDLMEHYLDVFVPGMTDAQKKHPGISPYYADLEPLRTRLPPALFTCGTEDLLLDDTVTMSAKWMAHGADTVVKIFPGAPHGYINFPRSVKGALSAEGLDIVYEFMKLRLEKK